MTIPPWVCQRPRASDGSGELVEAVRGEGSRMAPRSRRARGPGRRSSFEAGPWCRLTCATTSPTVARRSRRI